MAYDATAVNVRKAHAFAVVTSTGDRIAVRKTLAYAVLDSGSTIVVRKAHAYAVLADAAASRRRPVIIPPC